MSSGVSIYILYSEVVEEAQVALAMGEHGRAERILFHFRKILEISEKINSLPGPSAEYTELAKEFISHIPPTRRDFWKGVWNL